MSNKWHIEEYEQDFLIFKDNIGMAESKHKKIAEQIVHEHNMHDKLIQVLKFTQGHVKNYTVRGFENPELNEWIKDILDLTEKGK